MPWSRPTRAQWIAQARAIVAAKLGIVNVPRRSNLGVIAIVLGGIADAISGYIDWCITNVLLPTSAIIPYLLKWGILKGLTPDGPMAGTGAVAWTGGTPGATIPIGQGFVQQGTNLFYQTTSVTTLDDSGNGTATVVAMLADADSDGSDWNCPTGTVFTMQLALPGVPGQATVSMAIENGAAPESLTSFQARVVAAFQNPPQGGAYFDYIAWARAVPGVTRAWCAPNYMGPGTVAVFFMMDAAESAYSGFPQGTDGVATGETRAAAATGDQLAVANGIFTNRKQPVTALVYAMAPTAAPQALSIKYVPVGQQAAVEAALDAFFVAAGQAVYINPSTYATGGMTLNLADIQAKVRAVAQCAEAIVTSPTDNVGLSIGQLPSRGTITWL